MPDTVVTNTTLAAFDTTAAITKTLATVDTDGGAEVFVITPTETTARLAIIIGSGSNTPDDDISYSFAAGGMWAGQIVAGTVTKNTEAVIQVETAHVLGTDGKILLTLDPAATDKLKSDHAAYVKVIELV